MAQRANKKSKIIKQIEREGIEARDYIQKARFWSSEDRPNAQELALSRVKYAVSCTQEMQQLIEKLGYLTNQKESKR